MKAQGFVSNIYVFVNFITAVIGGIFFILLIFLGDNNFYYIPATLFLVYHAMFSFLTDYRHAPVAYRRFTVNSEGVRCGKLFVKFENIERIVFRRGYIEEYYGFKFWEDFSGMEQHIEIYVEDMICINCDFEGFKTKKSEECIYVPRNKKTDMLMRKYCDKYATLVNSLADKYENTTQKCKGKISSRVFGVIVLFFMISLITVMLVANDMMSIYKVVFLIPMGLLWILLLVFKDRVTMFVSSRIMNRYSFK